MWDCNCAPPFHQGQVDTGPLQEILMDCEVRFSLFLFLSLLWCVCVCWGEGGGWLAVHQAT